MTAKKNAAKPEVKCLDDQFKEFMDSSVRGLTFLVPATKGGVGKSHVSREILSPFNLIHHAASNLIEIDDQNKDSDFLTETKLKTKQVQLGNDPQEYSRALTDAFFREDRTEGLTVDIGGNRTTEIVLAELARVPARALTVDAIAIPVSDNRQSVFNAEKLLNYIAELNGGAQLLARCFIVVNRAHQSCMGGIDSPTFKYRYNRVVELINKYNLPHIMVAEASGSENISYLGLTIHEVVQRFDELMGAAMEEWENAEINGNREDMGRWEYYQTLLTDCQSTYYPNINQSWQQLKKVLIELKKRRESLSKAA